MNKQSNLFNLIVLVTFFVFTGCNKENDELLEVFKVTFETNGGTQVEAQEIVKGGVVKEPTSPERAGHEFVEWTKEEEAYDFKSEVVNDFTLTAKWEELVVTHNVTFQFDNETKDSVVTIIEDEKIVEPQHPLKDGYIFKYWSVDGTPFKFDSPITEDLTLIAVYEEVINQFVITFDPDNGEQLQQVTIDENEKVTPPEEPTKDKFLFEGWYNGDQLFDFETKITENINLKAKWETAIVYVDLNDGTLTSVNTYWWGKGGNYFENMDEMDCYDEKVIDGKIKISNLNFIDMMTKMGTAISNYDGTTVDPDHYPNNQLDIQYAAYPAKVEDGEQYLVMYKAPKSMGPTWNPDSLVFVNPVQLNTISFTNNAYGYLSMKQGDWLAKKFEAGDWFKVTVKGWDKDGNPTGTIDVSLAEGEDILDTWKAVDLSLLGVVSKLTFDMSSSDPATAPPGDFKTPMYFCMKDISFFKDIDEE
ncbi:DUF4465 domain-containing protein [Flammeovirga yaeyamensis]|uniref:DUF4465 domain-containing protein n=1 Tax=Flammeovirga yaeyamensis TaxID=367791 RepID=A0AAX1NEL3_9BACT|nr:InlB B-repeat-containing protein [Flammeovirga yaeyamensis]MBB3697026.1 hypothetical protein [Flammeovirga yaeyamensis]NMF33689.1 DUF4465 domain-containing protein [Flammeovirga yaeyamensis]QWG05045.1 DUF4465 domain-containing protein [Flammeovirga yaeyamensis]